jgi:ribosomal protein S18 acetylase RimI-like enzyme
VGRALLEAVQEAAAEAGCLRLWLVTTNNNVRAFDVFQRFGFDLCELRRNAVDEARRTIKPSISERDEDGVPIAHELELELLLR